MSGNLESPERRERDRDRGLPTTGAALDLRATHTPVTVILSNQFVRRSVSSLIHCLTKQVHTQHAGLCSPPPPPAIPLRVFPISYFRDNYCLTGIGQQRTPPQNRGVQYVCETNVRHSFLRA